MNPLAQEEMFSELIARYGQRRRREGKRRAPLKSFVLDLLRAAGLAGLTVDEIERHTRLPHQSVSARVHELWKVGAILAATTDEGKIIRRPTRMGRPATVFRVAGEGVGHGA